MNLLYLIPFAELGGTERHLATLIRELGDRVNPLILAPSGEGLRLFRDLGVPLRPTPELRVGSGMLRSLAAYRQAVAEAAAEHQPDLIHAHAGIECALVARRALPHTPIVFTAHGYLDLASYVASALAARRSVDELICVSEHEKRLFLRCGLGQGNLTVIRNGVPPATAVGGRLAPGAAGAARRREFVTRLGLQGQDLTLIGTVCRLHRAKGLDYLLAAFARVRRDCPETALVIAGGGREALHLAERARDLGVASATLFLGPCTEPLEVMEALDIFVSASFREALGLSILEAMSVARPVVAARVGGVPEVVVDGTTGLLVRPRDSEGLARALMALVRDPAKRKEYGARGLERFQHYFTADEMAERTLDVYRRALAARRHTT